MFLGDLVKIQRLIHTVVDFVSGASAIFEHRHILGDLIPRGILQPVWTLRLFLGSFLRFWGFLGLRICFGLIYLIVTRSFFCLV